MMPEPWSGPRRNVLPAGAEFDATLPTPGPAAEGAIPDLRHLGDFRILRELGRGGMGVVYEAEQQSLRRRVALKVLPGDFARRGKARERFRQEARAAARLHHTNIVPVFEVGQENVAEGREVLYYAMQYIAGRPLDDVVAELTRLRGALGTAPPAPGEVAKSRRPGVSFTAVAGADPDEEANRIDSAATAPFAGLGPQALALLSGTWQAIEAVSGSRAGATPHPASSVDVGAGEAVRVPAEPTDRTLPAGIDDTDPRNGPAPDRTATPMPRFGPTYWRGVAELGRQGAEALAYAHSRGIVHRDVKPGNLLLDAGGTVWVADFGLAKAADAEDALTETGEVVGTLRYMAPERFRGECGPAADTYALGLVLYELICLRPAFAASTREELLRQVLDAEPIRPRTLDPKIPRDLETIVLKAIEKHPERRYASAEELAEDLRRFVADEPIRARRLSSLERVVRWGRRNPPAAAAIGAIAGLLVLIAVGAVLVAEQFRRDAEDKELLARESSAAAAHARGAERVAEAARAREAALRAQAEGDRNELQRLLYFAEMNLAGDAARSPGGLVRTAELLDNHRSVTPDPRGWEWFYLESLLHRDAATLTGHTAGVNDLAWSPDGRTLATASSDGTLRLRTPFGGVPDRVLGGKDSGLACPIWSRDGRRLTTLSGANRIVVWDVDRLIPVREFALGDHRPIRFSPSPDGKRLAVIGRAAADRSRVRIVSAEDGKILREFVCGTSFLKDAAWSPTGRTVAAAGDDQKVYLFDPETSGSVAVHADTYTLIHSLAWSPDGTRLAAGGGDMRIRVWNISPDGAPATAPIVLSGHLSGVLEVEWHSAGRRLASASADATVRMWDVDARREISVRRGHRGEVRAVAWHPDGALLASGSADRTVKLWRANDDDESEVRIKHDRAVTGLFWSREGRTLVSSGADGTLRARNLEDGSLPTVSKLEGYPDGMVRTSVTNRAAVVSEGTLLLLDLVTGAEIPTQLDADLEYVNIAATSDGVRCALIGKEESGIRVRNLAENRDVVRLKPPKPCSIYGHSWSPDGQRLATTCDARVWIWNLVEASPTPRILPLAGERVRATAWSPDGKRLAAAGYEPQIRILDLETWAIERTLSGHLGEVYALAWSPDGSRLASGGSDGTVRLWEPIGGQQTAVLTAGSAPIRKLAWSEDGLALASGDDDGNVLVRDTMPVHLREDSPALLPELERRLAANPDDLDALKTRLRIFERLERSAEVARDRAAIRQVLRKRLAAAPQDRDTAVALANSFDTQDIETHLHVARPTAARAELGSRMDVGEDGIVRVSGRRPAFEVYRLTLPLPTAGCSALRLEAVPDPKLPGGAAGRSDPNGSFHLAEISCEITGPDGTLRPLTPRWVWSDIVGTPFFDRNRGWPRSADLAVDGDLATHWSPTENLQSPHYFTVGFDPVPAGTTGEMIVRLDFGPVPEHALGCFRLAFVGPQAQTAGRLDPALSPADPRCKAAPILFLEGARTEALDVLKHATASGHEAGLRELWTALLHFDLGETEAARRAYDAARKIYAETPPDLVAEGLLPAAMSLIEGISPAEAGARLRVPRERWERQRLDRAVAESPGSPEVFARRARWFEARARWTEAAADRLEAVRLQPGWIVTRLWAAPVLVLAGNRAGYEQFVKDTNRDFEGISDPISQERWIKSVLLLPGCCSVEALPVERLRQAVRGGRLPRNQTDWAHGALALAALRAGNFSEAVAEADEACRSQSSGLLQRLAMSVKAIAEKRLGREDSARALLLDVTRNTSHLRDWQPGKQLPGLLPDGTDAFITEVIRREAAAEIPLPPSPPPAPSDEMLRAEWAELRERFRDRPFDPADKAARDRRINLAACLEEWADCRAALERECTELPDDWWSTYRLATLLAWREDLPAFEAVAVRATDRGGTATDVNAARVLSRLVVLVPAPPAERLAAVTDLLGRTKDAPEDAYGPARLTGLTLRQGRRAETAALLERARSLNAGRSGDLAAQLDAAEAVLLARSAEPADRDRAEILCRNHYRSAAGRSWASRLGHGNHPQWQNVVWAAVLFREANRLLAEPPPAVP